MKKNYILIYILILFNSVMYSQNNTIDTKSTDKKIEELFYLINRMYVDSVNENELTNNLLKGMYNGLSPHCLYYKNEMFSKLNTKKQSIGIEFKFKGDTIIIEKIIKNSGASLADLKKGDKIFKIDGNNISDLFYYSDISDLLIGDSGSTVNLDYIQNTDTLHKEIIRKSITNYNLTLIDDFITETSINSYRNAINFFDAIYPDSVSNAIITEYGIRYMLEQLDPHSTYISLEDVHDMNAPLKGSFTGVGVRFQILKDTIMVVQAIQGGPSEKVGIMAGDKIVMIDDEIVGGIGIKNSGVRDRLLGEKGTKVIVGVLRSGISDILDFTIERDKIPIFSVDASYMASPTIGYIKLNNFSANSVSEIKKAIYRLKSEGMKDMILDLQNNGGGYLMTAVDLADEFLSGEKQIVSTKGRQYPDRSFTTKWNGLLEDGNVVIMVNESSASASEIVSGAIQDWDRGLIVGRRTFGKGLVQKPINLPDGTQVRITTSKYYTPSGRCIQKPYEKGVIAYRKEKYSRYSSGESFHKDSIKFNTEDIYETKLKNRTVYGGGGIMPDIFVPLDTSGMSSYYNKLIRKGILNRFALEWVNDNRDKLEKKYSSFKKFKINFKTDKVVKELTSYAEKEGLEFNEKEYNKAENTIRIRLKANIAQNLYDYAQFYEIINELNASLQKSISLLENEIEFKKLANK